MIRLSQKQIDECQRRADWEFVRLKGVPDRNRGITAGPLDRMTGKLAELAFEVITGVPARNEWPISHEPDNGIWQVKGVSKRWMDLKVGCDHVPQYGPFTPFVCVWASCLGECEILGWAFGAEFLYDERRTKGYPLPQRAQLLPQRELRPWPPEGDWWREMSYWRWCPQHKRRFDFVDANGQGYGHGCPRCGTSTLSCAPPEAVALLTKP
jgi:hypothetical protein